MTVTDFAAAIRQVVIPGKDHIQPMLGDCSLQIWDSYWSKWKDLTADKVGYDVETKTIRLGRTNKDVGIKQAER